MRKLETERDKEREREREGGGGGVRKRGITEKIENCQPRNERAGDRERDKERERDKREREREREREGGRENRKWIVRQREERRHLSLQCIHLLK